MKYRSLKMAHEEQKVLPLYRDSGFGFPISEVFSLDAFNSGLQYRPRADDLFIVTYPKSGTIWVQNIVASIYSGGQPFRTAVEFFTSTPYLEMAGKDAAKTIKRPGAIKTHLPFHMVPWSGDTKYILVARNPKDLCISFYYHTKNISGYGFQDGKFDDFFELFMEGKVDYGDYYDWLLPWYNQRNEPNVLFLTYEELKEDTTANILKIADFMGQKYKDLLLQEDGCLLEDVLRFSSFGHMKDTLDKQIAELAALPRDVLLNHPDLPEGLRFSIAQKDDDSNPPPLNFVRKGIVGDWRNHFSPEQNERMNNKFRERTKGTHIPQLWKKHM